MRPMKKVIIFLLSAAIALGGLVFAHASVTDSQDELIIFPIEEYGDRSVLSGKTAGVTFTCGDHLRWHSDYSFDTGLTETEFDFNAFGHEQRDYGDRSGFGVYFSGGMGSSVSGGSFSLSRSSYGDLFRAVAVITPDGESRTMNLKMADYVNYYLPEFDLQYEDDTKTCWEQISLHGQITGNGWHEESHCYETLLRLFRFPVQEDHIVEVGVGKDEVGSIIDINLYPENGPELRFISDVTADGVWFIPVFRDEQGDPLDFESPNGFGIYHVPWRTTGATTHYADDVTKDVVTMDLNNLELVLSLDPGTRIEAMEIDAETGAAWMLTREDEGLSMSRLDLEAGTVGKTTPLLPWDAQSEDTYVSMLIDDGYLLITAQSQLALYDMAADELLLTAPYDTDRPFCPSWYEAAEGELHFDGEYLYMIKTAPYRDGAFFAAVFRQGGEAYLGVYDCTLLRGNDDWYYSSIYTESEPAILK